jgi:Zn-finger nucleic acid-binding protein/regulator of replication initiation timing
MEELQRQVETLLKEVAELRAEVVTLCADNAELRAEDTALRTENAEWKAQVAELQLELVRRKKGFRPKANTSTRTKSTQDRRKADERKHPGTTRPEPPIDEGTVQQHEVTADVCPDCQGALLDTGEFIDQIVEDIPQPQVEVHRYRRHVDECPCCQKRVTGTSTEVSPHARIWAERGHASSLLPGASGSFAGPGERPLRAIYGPLAKPGRGARTAISGSSDYLGGWA